MRAIRSGLQVLAAVGVLTLAGTSLLVACHTPDRVSFTAADELTGPLSGEMPPVPPDPDGIIRLRDVPLTNFRLTFDAPRLGIAGYAVDIEFAWNANIEALGAPGNWTCWGECRGYVTGNDGTRECVLRSYYHSRRGLAGESLWVSDAQWLGTFCSGPLEGIAFDAREIGQSTHPLMVTGYSGKLFGVLIIPDGFERPVVTHPKCEKH